MPPDCAAQTLIMQREKGAKLPLFYLFYAIPACQPMRLLTVYRMILYFT